MMKAFFLKPSVIAGFLLGLATLALYSYTVAPDVLAHDVADWQASAATLGIAHAPGSPAYDIVAWLFSLAPVGNVAVRVNFLSAVIGAIGVVAVYALSYTLFGRMLPALVSSITLAVGGLWWSHAAVANPYNVVPAISAILLTLLLIWRRNGDNRLVWAGAALFGAGITWHITLLFFLPVLVAGIFFLGPWRGLFRTKPLLLTLAFFLLGISPYLFLPIRSAMHPLIDYQPINSITSFIRYVSASDARAEGHETLKLPGLVQTKDLLVQVVQQSYFPSYAFLVFGPAIVLLYPAVWPALRKLWRPLLFLAAAMVAHMFFLFFFSGDYPFYHLSLLMYFSVWTGFSVFLIMCMGEAYLGRGRLRHLPVIIIGAVYFAVLLLGVTRTWDFVNHRNDYGMRQYINTVFDHSRQDAVILADWDSYTGLLYAQKIDGERPDIRLIAATREKLPGLLRQAEEENPGAQILISVTLPFEPLPNLKELGGPFPLDYKAVSYQDFEHGGPFPVAEKLYEVKGG